MHHLDAMILVDQAVENGILDEGIAIYREASETEREGWYLESRETVARNLMQDEAGQKELIKALKEKGVEFVPKADEIRKDLKDLKAAFNLDD